MKRAIYFLILVIFCTFSGSAQQCKRKGIIDCKGQCGRFIDKDGDLYCDFSPRSISTDVSNNENTKTVPVPDTVKRGVIEKKQPALINPVQSTVAPINITKKKTEKEIIIEPDPKAIAQPASEVTQAMPVPIPVKTVEVAQEKPYALMEICGATLFLYFITSLLVKAKAMKKATHRKIWNVILLLTFVMSGLLGLLLVVQLNYNFAMDWYMGFLKLHVEFGIAMALISIIHVIWHTSYYLNMIRKKKIN